MPPYDTLPPFSPLPDSLIQPVKILCAYDTVFTPLDHAEPMPRKSLFTHHLLPVHNNYEISISHASTSGWYLGGIMLSILFITLFMRVRQLRLPDLFLSLFNEQTLDRMLRETNLTRPSSQAIIAPIVLLPIALVAQYLWLPAHNEWQAMLHFVLLYLVSIVAYFLRNGLFRFIGNAFFNKEAVHLCLSSNYIYHLVYGIATSLLAFFVCFTDGHANTFATALGVVLSLLYLMRLIRGAQLILSHAKTSKLYLFYYLCTLEIAPLVIVISNVISL